MIESDPISLPLIDALSLFSRVGCEAVADVPLADETVPVSGQWRMAPDQWRRYRGLCGDSEILNRRALAVCS